MTYQQIVAKVVAEMRPRDQRVYVVTENRRLSPDGLRNFEEHILNRRPDLGSVKVIISGGRALTIISQPKAVG